MYECSSLTDALFSVRFQLGNEDRYMKIKQTTAKGCMRIHLTVLIFILKTLDFNINCFKKKRFLLLPNQYDFRSVR